ncbi:PepSY domain-containing protein [Halopseudomonas nanhaiensis]|uniref:PepSY domain-containing protein n=1 Tax=Halopseudomonas nanhaiensis TaxID=2830842 RepID=UPI001CBC4715|nr:PepSY domain-containing protein [Halopseudomonas nanhaiensis]UAW97140.1 PepSY domain-containing protein [Halopseudomonas nanhaiensis]
MRATEKFCRIVRTTERPLARASLFTALLALPWLVQAGREVSQDEALQLAEDGELQPLQLLVDDALVRHPGRLLEAELEAEDGRYVYEIEIVTRNGRVMELEYDGRTGELLEVDEED